MAPPYSTDFRWRVIWLSVVHNLKPATIALLLSISDRTVRRYLDQFNQTGDVQPQKYRHGPQPIFGEFEQILIIRLISDNTSIYLYEVKQKLEQLFGVPVSESTICRTVKKLGFTRKKIHYIALQQSELLRAKFMAVISAYDAEMIIWIDESGCDRRNCTRKYGYSLRGLPARDHRILARGKRYSAIPILSMEGIHDVYLAEGAVNGEKFESFLEECLLPVIMPFNGVNPRSIVVMDNASIHHTEAVIDLIENKAQAKLIFLPPYSPDLIHNERERLDFSDI